VIGLRILPEISRSAYGLLGFGDEDVGGAGAPSVQGGTRHEGGGGETARVWAQINLPAP
jgi:hypothetical protein